MRGGERGSREGRKSERRGWEGMMEWKDKVGGGMKVLLVMVRLKF
jgi:hypothetical protein